MEGRGRGIAREGSGLAEEVVEEDIPGGEERAEVEEQTVERDTTIATISVSTGCDWQEVGGVLAENPEESRDEENGGGVGDDQEPEERQEDHGREEDEPDDEEDNAEQGRRVRRRMDSERGVRRAREGDDDDDQEAEEPPRVSWAN